jgi:serine/threonine-protein kinase
MRVSLSDVPVRVTTVYAFAIQLTRIGYLAGQSVVGIYIDRVYLRAASMGNFKPDEDSAHEHELVTDDELLEDGVALSPAESDDLHEPSRVLRLDDAPRRTLLSAGDVLAGKYRVERVYTPGALGISCDALHLQLRQRVVLKLGLAGVRPGAEGRARFLRSARLAAQLRNEHLARVLDIGTLDTGIPYSVTEHLSGSDMRGVLRVREWLPVPEAIDYVLQVCEGLAVAHVAGLVHGNLKLSNVFLARENDGRPIVKVLDFSLSDAAAIDSSITMPTTESVVSSLACLAPEQVRDPNSVDVRADIWAIGALLHELLTGVPLHVAASVPGIIAAIAADSPTPISKLRGGIPTELEEIVLRCLEKERDYRWSDVGTLAKQLQRFASAEGRDAVNRVVMVLERRTRSPRNARSQPPAELPKTGAAQPITPSVSSVPRVDRQTNRRALEVALAGIAILGFSVGLGAVIAVHHLQAALAARAATERPVVASLSPALPATAVAALRLPSVPTPAPVQAAPSASSSQLGAARVVHGTHQAASTLSAAPAVETSARSSEAAPSPRQAVLEPTASSQALFDKAN